MNQLSSNTLFHFTHRFDVLIKILQDGLRFSAIGESIPGTSLKYIVDAICFCDIPLSAIRKHCEWYGNYGIGFKPSYCKQIGATPVCYVHSSSKHLPSGKNCSEKYQSSVLTPYLKPTCGMQKKYKCHKRHWNSYYNEKEWRAVADNMTIYNRSYIRSLDELDKAVQDIKSSRKPNEWIYAKQKFGWDDVEYIIFESNKDIPAFEQWMTSYGAPQSLQQKIITVRQLLKDF